MMQPGSTIQGAQQIYTVSRALGSGAMSEVYLASTTIEWREVQVVLRVLRPHVPQMIIDGFFLESEILDAFKIAEEKFDGVRAIPERYETMRAGEVKFLAQEFVRGQSLKDLLDNPPYYLDECVALTIAAQVARVLHLLHSELKRSYTDFQLRNIYWDQNDLHVWVVDWSHVSDIFTNEEQSDRLKQANLRQLGVYLYKMLTGKAADPQGETERDLAQRAGERWQVLSVGVRRLILKVIQPSPRQYVFSAATLREEATWLTEQWAKSGLALATEIGGLLSTDTEESIGRAEVVLDLARRRGGVPERALQDIDSRIIARSGKRSADLGQKVLSEEEDTSAPPQWVKRSDDQILESPARDDESNISLYKEPVTRSRQLPETDIDQAQLPPQESVTRRLSETDIDQAQLPPQESVTRQLSETDIDQAQLPPQESVTRQLPETDIHQVQPPLQESITRQLPDPELDLPSSVEAYIPYEPYVESLPEPKPTMRDPERTGHTGKRLPQFALLLVLAVILVLGGIMVRLFAFPLRSSGIGTAEPAVTTTDAVGLLSSSTAQAPEQRVTPTATATTQPTLITEVPPPVTPTVTVDTRPVSLSIDQAAFEQTTLFDLPLKISGKAPPGAEVQIAVNGASMEPLIVSVATQDDGIWIWRPSSEEPALVAGSYTLIASLVNPRSGVTVLSTPVSFRIQTPPHVSLRSEGRVYTQPNTHVAFVNTLASGTLLDVLASSVVASDEWYYVRTTTSRRMGWIQTSYVAKLLSEAEKQRLLQQP